MKTAIPFRKANFAASLTMARMGPMHTKTKCLVSLSLTTSNTRDTAPWSGLNPTFTTLHPQRVDHAVGHV